VTEPPAAPPRRGGSVLTLVLAVGLAISVVLAVTFGVSLQAARDRIEELEKEVEATGPPQGGGGPLEEVLEDLLGEGENPLEGLGGDVFGCIGAGALGGDAVEPPSGPPAAQVRTLAEEVEEIRELTFRRPVRPRFLADEAIERRIREMFLEDYTPEVADREARILTALGAIPPGLDLVEARARALGGSVAGFYVPETGELVVGASGGDLGPLEWVTLVHELEHAVADQRLDLPVPEEIVPGREDADVAALAVVEGDATLAMQRYSSSLPFDQQIGLLDPEAIADAEAGLAGLPYILEQELLFPYEDGLTFVCDLYQEGGWNAVDRAYGDPPTTTAQVLFPERYAEREGALDPRDTGRLAGGWRLEGTHQFGAATFLWLLEAPGGDPSRALDDPRAGAAAWGGGELRLWRRGTATAVGIAMAERDGHDVLCSAVSHWYASAFPGAQPRGSAAGRGLLLDGSRQDAALACDGDQIRLGIAPDPATARRLTD
jgi:hypothetical protein